MGKIVTPAYRVEYRDNHLAMRISAPDGLSRVDRKPVHMMAWNRTDGRPTAERLEAWRKSYNASFQSGGANAHVSEAFGSIPHIYWARIVRQRDDAVICEANAPAFEAA